MKIIPFLAGFLTLTLCPHLALAQTADPSARWETTIEKFEEADRENPPPQDAILFIGSSSIRGWRTLADDFPDFTVINRGFGGSQIADSVYFADRIILSYRPTMVVLYAGENDIKAGKSPEVVAQDFVSFVEVIRKELPGTRIAFISMKPSPSRWDIIDQIRKGNQLIRNYISTAPGVDYIDISEAMLGKDEKPNPKFYLKDNLHMTPAGYDLWQKIVRPYLAHHEAARCQK